MKSEQIRRRRSKMIVMDIKIDNFYAFKNFHMNMSYPKKIVNSFIKDEFLEGHSNFRYKKVNILMGANATGKTSFGKMLMSIFNFINKRSYKYICPSVANKEKKASFSIDFIVDSDILYRMECCIFPHSNRDMSDEDIDVYVKSVNINRNDSYESCAEKLNGILREETKRDYITQLEKIKDLHWYFEYPADAYDNVIYMPLRNKNFEKILENILKSLDPSIDSVKQSKDASNACVIRMNDGKSIIIQNGEKLTTDMLSSGTKSGVAIACFIDRMIEGQNTFYYCDEKFSYIHSDLEKAILTILIKAIKKRDQLFFTTHNPDILDLLLPKHSFTFFKKDPDNSEMPIECISASELLKRNTDSLRNAVENDLFSTAPVIDLIYDIEELF